jgi:multicomponent Na+:H+ antiporter subunit G
MWLTSDLISVVMIGVGAVFFLAGSLGLLRFPDVYSRLHALTKADNLGLGLVVVAVAIQADSWALALKLGFIWLLTTFSSATLCYLVAQAALRMEIKPWEKS